MQSYVFAPQLTFGFISVVKAIVKSCGDGQAATVPVC